MEERKESFFHKRCMCDDCSCSERVDKIRAKVRGQSVVDKCDDCSC